MDAKLSVPPGVTYLSPAPSLPMYSMNTHTTLSYPLFAIQLPNSKAPSQDKVFAVQDLIRKDPKSFIHTEENRDIAGECCDRLFLEEFEDMNIWNIAKEVDKQLSYSQDISGKKGFTRQRVYDIGKIMKMKEHKRKL